MNPRIAAIISMVIGAVMIVVFVGADLVGLGKYPALFGEIQWLGTSLGAVLLMLGFSILLWVQPRTR